MHNLWNILNKVDSCDFARAELSCHTIKNVRMLTLNTFIENFYWTMKNVNKNEDIHTEQKKKSGNIWFSICTFLNTTVNKTDVIQSCQWKTNFGIKKALEKHSKKKIIKQLPQNETHTHAHPNKQTKNLQILLLKKKKASSLNRSDPNL